jgi:hypothetical protein
MSGRRGLTRRANVSKTRQNGRWTNPAQILSAAGRSSIRRKVFWVAKVSDVAPVELPAQPLPPVQIHLDLKGKPGLDSDVHEAKLAV